MKRRVAVIVDPYTSGAQLAPALLRLGYECWCVQSQPSVPAVFRGSQRPEDFARSVRHEGDVAQTCARLAGAGGDVEFVIAGCELGVELADALALALGLPSNAADARPARRDKGLMADAFRHAGLSVPRQCCSSRLEPLLEWVRSDAGGPWVVKPSASSSSDGVELCETEQDVERAFRSILGSENVLGLCNRRVVVQRYASGSEYVVDTVSHAGRHRLVAFWGYRKPAPTASFMGYDTMDLLPSTGDVQARLLDTACGGLDALGIRFGPAHSEIVWSESGPMLLEIGARLHGGDNPRLASLCGAPSHVAETVSAYTDPAHFAAVGASGYALTRHCTIAFMMPPSPGRLRGLPRLHEIEALESLHEMEVGDCVGEPVPPVIGWVALIHPDRDVIERDLASLRRLEREGLYEVDCL